MKIFNRGAETAKPAQPEAAKGQPEAAPAPAAQPAPAPPAPDLTAIIDANVKEMSEKIARLASSIESEHSERSDFEAKLEKMEERMRKLSSLTEMISAQYNPFVGAAPTEREPMPQPEIGLSMPPLAAAAPPLAVEVPPPAAPAPLQIALDDPHASLAPALGEAPMPSFDAPPALEPAAAAPLPEDASPARLWSVAPGFASSMLCLNWAEMLLKHAPSRDAVADVLNYYCNVGWLGEPARDQMLAYADGLAYPSEGSGGDWRGTAEMHEKSLLFIEKLRALGSRGD